MINDTESAAVMAAAESYASSYRATAGRELMNRDRVATHIETAYIAGYCAALQALSLETAAALPRGRAS